MKSGDILLFKELNKLMQLGTNSEYSHVAICVSPHMNLAIEANTIGGVRAISIRKIKVAYDIYRVKENYAYDLDSTISYLIDRLNNKYDYKGRVYLGFLKLLNKIGISTKNYTNKFQKERDYFVPNFVMKHLIEEVA